MSGNLPEPIPKGTPIVLIVDDEPDIAEGLEAFLQMRLPRAHFISATGPREALAMMEDTRVSLIVTDFRMPDMDGLEFLDEVQKRWPGTPRLMMTAYADVQLAARAVNENKVAYFLLKPIDPQTLVDAIGTTLGQIKKEKHQSDAFGRAMDLVREATRHRQ